MSETTADKKRLPLRKGRFIVPEDPKQEPYIVGCKCGNCGKYFVPPRVICLNCSKMQMETVALGGKGTIYSYTIVHQQLPFSVVQVPYAIVIVVFEEGCQIHGVITGDLSSVAVGAPVEVYYEKVKEDEDGNDLIVDKFRVI